jgi:polyisoprenoid-binding protein YceI
VWLADPTDFLSLRGNVSLPVDRFATGGESRDTKMKEVMHADTHPEVTFQLDGVTEGGARCPVEEHECAYTASGSLTISGHTEQVKFPLRVRPTSAVYEATAELDLKWADYGVEDPSILIATLDPIVHVSVRVIIPMNSKS